MARRKEVRDVDLLGVGRVEEVDENGRFDEDDVTETDVLNDSIDLQPLDAIFSERPCPTATSSLLEGAYINEPASESSH